MKDKLILSIAALFMIMMFTACSTNETSENAEKNKESTQEVKENKDTKKSEENTLTADDFTDEGIIKPEVAKKKIEKNATELINAISKKDSVKIAEFVHPEKGVRFTPYTHVSIDKDVVFHQAESKSFFDNKQIYLWGYYDGSGNEISLTPSQYFDQFIYSADFVNAEKVGYNEVLRSGNIEENQFEVYKSAIIVEYYFSGFNPDYGGADWKSLRLVFEQYQNDWKLVGIIHNQMTL